MGTRILAVRILIGVALSAVAFHFERAVGQRMNLLLLLMCLYSLLPVLRVKTAKPSVYYVEFAVIFGLNYLSRFNVSIIFMSFYFISVMAYLQKYRKKAIAILGMGLMTVNFYLVAPYGLNYELFTEMIFLEIIMALMILTFHYLSSYRDEKIKVERLLDDNEEKRRSLEVALERLSNQNESLEMAQVEVIRLTRIAERAEMASALHDTVGHEMAGLIMQIEMLNLKYQDELAKESAEHAREILRTIRKTVEVLQETEHFQLTMSILEEKVNAFARNSGLKIHLSFEVDIEQFESEITQMIYRTVLEGLTNVWKHSSASDVWILLSEIQPSNYILKIIDNGKSSETSNPEGEGNGLRFIRKRVLELGGQVEILQSPSGGFQILIRFIGELNDKDSGC